MTDDSAVSGQGGGDSEHVGMPLPGGEAAGVSIYTIKAPNFGGGQDGAMRNYELPTSWAPSVAEVIKATDALPKIHAAAWADRTRDALPVWRADPMLGARMHVQRLLR